MSDIQNQLRIAARESGRKSAFEEAARIAENFESDGNPFPTIQGAIAEAIRAGAALPAPQAGCAKEGWQADTARAITSLENSANNILAVDGDRDHMNQSRLTCEQTQMAAKLMRAVALHLDAAPPPPVAESDSVSFPRWWIQHLYTGLNRINTANVPGEAGDFIFTLRHQLLDKLSETAPPAIVAEEQTGAR